MIWARKDLEIEQLPLNSCNLTAVLVHLPDRSILVVSVYIPGMDPVALQRTLGLLQQLIESVQHRIGTRVDIILASNFNQHN